MWGRMIRMRGFYTPPAPPALPRPQKRDLADETRLRENDNDLPAHTVNTIICELQVCQTALPLVARAAGVFHFQSRRGAFQIKAWQLELATQRSLALREDVSAKNFKLEAE